jgi:molecular chaperone GrpE
MFDDTMNQEEKQPTSEDGQVPQEDLITEPQYNDSATESESNKAESNAELKDKYLRLYSEFENFRRRTAREKLELSKTAGEDIIKSVLPVLDDLDRAEQSMQNSNNIEAIREGVQLVLHKFRSILKQRGLEEMETLHQAFDSEFHEAIAQIPAPSKELEDKIIDQVEKGYYFQGKVIRYAKVVVGNKNA